jgi:hypothetical protein
VEWRVGEIGAPGVAGYRIGEPFKYEIAARWKSEEITTQNTEMSLPKDVCQTGRTYRVRARYKDNTGRWSHWSEPIQFVAGQPNRSGE